MNVILIDGLTRQEVINELVRRDLDNGFDDDTLADILEDGLKGYCDNTDEELIRFYRQAFLE